MSRLDEALDLKTSPDRLAELVTIRNENIQWHVASNPNTDSTTLRMLANDYNWVVRGGVAENPQYTLSSIDSPC